MKLKRLFVFAFASLLLCNSALAMETQNSSKPAETKVSKYSISNPYGELAKRLGLPERDIVNKLTYTKDNNETNDGKNDKKISLVPLVESSDTFQLWKDLFMNANADYMKYYADGKLRSEERIKKDYNWRLGRIWDKEKPYSMTFVIKVGEDLAGKTSVGSLVECAKETLTEMDYVLLEKFSHQGVTTKAVGILLNFLRYLIEEGKYNFEDLRLTAKTENFASRHVAEKNGFVAEKDEIIEWDAPTLDFRINLKQDKK